MAAGPGPVMSCNLCDDFRSWNLSWGRGRGGGIPNSSVIRLTTWPPAIIWNPDLLITVPVMHQQERKQKEKKMKKKNTQRIIKSQHWQHFPDGQQPEQHQHRNKQRHCLDIPCPLVFQETWVCWNWLDWSSSAFEFPNSQNYMLLPNLCPSLYPKYKPPPPLLLCFGRTPPPKKKSEWLLLQKMVGNFCLRTL